jgi:hypothetical protein
LMMDEKASDLLRVQQKLGSIESDADKNSLLYLRNGDMTWDGRAGLDSAHLTFTRPGTHGDSRYLDKYFYPMIEQLIEYHVIGKEDRGTLSFELNKDGLIVNNVRQPADIFLLFAKKYLKNPADLFTYSIKNSRDQTLVVSVHQ